MRVVLGIAGVGAIIFLLLDIFRAVVLARRATGEYRFAYMFYRVMWPAFAAVALRTESGRRREAFLGVFGPLALLLLFLLWAVSLVFAFSLVRYSLSAWDKDLQSLSTDLYQSASSFLTIGAAETPKGVVRWVNVIEAGLGFSYLALVIGYLPVFYQSFARRELHISMLDARGGSPPSAAEILAREGKFVRQLERQLVAWEEWAADLMQDELSYPMLAYFRSQHVNQSWVSSLVAITDTSALISISADGELQHQAAATFAMGRHALIDSARVLGIKPEPLNMDRLTSTDLGKICDTIRRAGAALDLGQLQYERVAGLVKLYEPYSQALSRHLLMAMPAWISDKAPRDNWRIAPPKPGQDIFAVSDPFQDQERDEEDDEQQDRSA